MQSTAIIILPAMGLSARYYKALADALTQQSFHVECYEQPGHGERQPVPGWRADASYLTMVEEVHQLINELRNRGAEHVYLLGHSLGGHVAMALSAVEPQAADGLILMASGTPWYGAMGSMRRQAWLLTVLVSLSICTFGYFPGHRIGFGGREFRGVMRDWLNLARRNKLQVAGLPENLEQRLEEYRGPVLSISYGNDRFAMEKSRRLLFDKLPAADRQFKTLDGSCFGERNSHFEFARSPQTLVPQLTEWIHGQN